MNGRTGGDWEGKFMYVEVRGSSVIDYRIVNKEIFKRIKNFRIGEGVNLDHLLLKIEIVMEEKKKREQKKEKQEKSNEENEREITV